MELTDAIAGIHYPNDSITANNARKRLAFDELFLLQLALLSKKRRWQNDKPGYQFMVSDRYVEMFLSHLPYSLTRAQKRVLDEVTIDTAKGKPMLRLLQGEVGSGKTVIAIYTLLLAIINGYQAAFMAPTEVLAKQHYGSLCAFLSKIGSIETEAENPYISHYQF